VGHEAVVTQEAYEAWRSTELGRITESLETALVFDLAGRVRGRRVLDAGAGDATYAIEASARGAQSVAIEPDEGMIAAARRRSLARGGGVHLARAKVEGLPFPDASFDVVLAIAVLCLVRDPGAALRELERVLAPGGRLVIGELGRWSAWAAQRRIRGRLGHPIWRRARFWSRGSLRRMVESGGFRVDVVQGAVHYPPTGLAARAFFRIDRTLGRLRAPGPAFLAVAASKTKETG
jgi:ubiquinone/menaquinone biosynthesis C-methylase UbiE